MSPEQLTGVISWSHTSMSTYETCPRQYKGKYITKKFPFVQTPEAKWGDDVHNAIEKYSRDGAPLPSNMVQYKPYADAVLARPGEKLYENAFGVRVDQTPCGFFEKLGGKSVVWVRAKIDVINLRRDIGRAEVFDWKTGKRKDDPSQLVLYALLVFIHYPEIHEVRAGYCWLTDPVNRAFTAPVTFKRAQLQSLWDHYMAKYKNLEFSVETDYFPEKPSGLCNGWCEDQDCGFWRPRRAK